MVNDLMKDNDAELEQKNDFSKIFEIILKDDFFYVLQNQEKLGITREWFLSKIDLLDLSVTKNEVNLPYFILASDNKIGFTKKDLFF